MGEPLDKRWALSWPADEAGMVAGDREELLKKAFASRADLLALEEKLNAAGVEVMRARSTGLPVLNAFADATNDRDRMASSGGNNYTVGAKVSMPLLDPGRQGRVREALAQKERAAHEMAILKDRIRRDISEEMARQEAFAADEPVLKDMTRDALEASSLMIPLYREGRKSIVELMEVRRAYLQAAQGSEKVQAGLGMSRARLIFLVGGSYEGRMNREVGQ
jgi:outer membrane protein TolC